MFNAHVIIQSFSYHIGRSPSFNAVKTAEIHFFNVSFFLKLLITPGNHNLVLYHESILNDTPGC